MASKNCHCNDSRRTKATAERKVLRVPKPTTPSQLPAPTNVIARVQYQFSLPATNASFFEEAGEAGINVMANFSQLKCGYAGGNGGGSSSSSSRSKCFVQYTAIVGPPGRNSRTQNAQFEKLLAARRVKYTTASVAQVLAVPATPGSYAALNRSLVDAGIIAEQSQFGESASNISISFAVRKRDLARAIAALSTVQ